MRFSRLAALKRLPEISKPWLEMAQGLGTIFALCAALWWFYAQRFTHLNLKLEQTVTQRHMPGKDHRVLVFVDVRATNIGKIRIPMESGTLAIYQVNPYQHDVLKQITLDPITLEPGESDQPGLKSFYVDDHIKTLEINSFYRVPGTNKYWMLETVADLGPEKLPYPITNSTSEK